MATGGTVILRGSTYSVVLDLGRDENGKRIRKWHSGYPNKKDALKACRDLLGKLDEGTYVQPNRLTLRQFAVDQWLPSLATAVEGGRLKPNTAASYRIQVNSYILPTLGHIRLKDLSAAGLARFYGELLRTGAKRSTDEKPKGLAPTSVRLVHVTIHRMLKDAMRWGLVARNVADAAAEDAPRRRKTGEATIKVWEPSQLSTFLEAVKDDRLFALWHLLITTGVRRGEAVGLRWEDVDLDGARLTIEQARVRLAESNEVAQGTTKSGRSRQFGLDVATVAVLRRHWSAQAEERLAWGPGWAGSGLVFTWEDGRPLHPDLVSRRFARLAEAAGLPAIRLHDLRHSYASAGLKAGVPIKVMQERLGHSSIAITGDIYSHVAPDVDQAAADRVAAVILGGPTHGA